MEYEKRQSYKTEETFALMLNSVHATERNRTVEEWIKVSLTLAMDEGKRSGSLSAQFSPTETHSARNVGCSAELICKRWGRENISLCW